MNRMAADTMDATPGLPARAGAAGAFAQALRRVVDGVYGLLGLLACIALIAAFLCVGVGVAVREAGGSIGGLDSYAGFSIAAALFLALPMTLRHGDHIRVTLFLERLPARARDVLEYWGLLAGLALSGYTAWFACRLVWVSYVTNDVSQGADATPLWIPQIAMALGCLGFALAFADALVARLRGRDFFDRPDGDIARVE